MLTRILFIIGFLLTGFTAIAHEPQANEYGHHNRNHVHVDEERQEAEPELNCCSRFSLWREKRYEEFTDSPCGYGLGFCLVCFCGGPLFLLMLMPD